MILINLLDKLLPLVGVLIGGIIGLASPWVSHRLEIKKRKRSLKYDLVNNVYVLYNLLKLEVGLQNQLRFITKRLDLANEKKIIHYQNDLIEYNELNKSLDNNFMKMTEIESKLIALNAEVGDYYSAKINNALSELLSKPLSDSNNSARIIIDFDSITDEEYVKNSTKILNEYNSKMSAIFQSDCDLLINKIKILFNQ